MAKILTLTFNPALDKRITVPELISGVKLHSSAPVFKAGGGGINVAKAIKHLGGDAIAVYLSGGFAGKKIGELLKEESVNFIPVSIRDDTRENIILNDTATESEYLLDLPGPVISENEWKDCLKNVDKIYGIEYIVVSGSFPTGLPDDIFLRLAHIAKKKNAKLLADTSGKPLSDAVRAGAYLIKPNLRELSMLTGRADLTANNAGNAARELLRSTGCSVIVVSLGSLGAILVTRDFVLEVRPPQMEIVSTVGAGDSLVAGLVYWLSLGKDLKEAARFGVACGSAATLNPGSELCKKADADNIYQAMLRVAAVA